MGKIKLEGFKCERCGHTWIPREATKDDPKVCPSCKSPYWNTPRKKQGSVSKATNAKSI